MIYRPSNKSRRVYGKRFGKHIEQATAELIKAGVEYPHITCDATNPREHRRANENEIPAWFTIE